MMKAQNVVSPQTSSLAENVSEQGGGLTLFDVSCLLCSIKL